MNILFVVTGVGLGDSTRIHAIIDAFVRKYPNAKILVAGYDNSYEYFRKKFQTIMISGYKIPGEEMRFKLGPFVYRNYLLPFVWLFTAIRLRWRVKKFKPDIVISDFEPSGIAIAKFVGKKCVSVFGYDPKIYEQYKRENGVSALMRMQATYLQKVYDSSDYVIIPSFVKYERRSRLYHYVEPIVRETPNALPSEEEIMRELKLDRKPVVVMLGGSNFGIALAKSIASLAHEFNEYFVFFGSGFKLPEQKNVVHHQFHPDFLKYLKVSKALITLGGQKTLCEGVVFGKPMLIYPIQEHVEQQLNAYSLKDVALVDSDLKPEAVKRKIEELLHNAPELEKKVKKLGFRGKGAEQVVWFVEGLVRH